MTYTDDIVSGGDTTCAQFSNDLCAPSSAPSRLDKQERTSGRVGGEPGVAPIDSNYGKGLQVEVMIEDPNVFTMPWSANVTYRRVPRSWAESVCAENNTDVLHQGFEHVPVAAKPDF